MNKLMIALLGTRRLMMAAGDPPGGDPPTPPAGDPPKNDPPTPPAGDPPKDPPKSVLADPPKNDPPTPPAGDPPKSDPPKPEFKDEDYMKALVVDDETKKLAGSDDFKLNEAVMKDMLPVLREAGVNPEQMGKLANAYARGQIARLQAAAEEQANDMKAGNDLALKTFTNKHDWELMKAARDHFFKMPDKDGKGGEMLHTITYSGIGNNLEFLALLKFAGEHLAVDTTGGKGGAGAGGGGEVNFAKALGFPGK